MHPGRIVAVCRRSFDDSPERVRSRPESALPRFHLWRRDASKGRETRSREEPSVRLLISVAINVCPTKTRT